MTPKLKIIRLFAFFALLSSFCSCDEDEILIESQNHAFHLKTSRVSIKQVLNEINSTDIKEKLQYRNFDSSANNSLNRSNNPEVYFLKNEKEDELTSYILHLNSYSQLKPYFLKLIITKNNNETEKMGFLKYIPTSPTNTLNLRTFSGVVQILDFENEVTALTTFENGIPISTDSTASSRMNCYDKVNIIAVNCGDKGNHPPGVACDNGTINSYWIISITTVCTGRGGQLVQILEDSGDNSNNGGGTYSASMFLNPFLSTLTPEQLLVYNSNPSFEEYLVNNLIVEPNPNYNPLLGGNPNNVIIKPEAEQFVTEFINNAINSGLNLNFKKSSKSPANIDVSAIDTTTTVGKKFNCIYNKLMQSPSFKNLFDNTFGGTQSKLNVKFEIVESFPNSNTLGNCQLTTISNNGIPQQFNNLIKLKREMLDESNGTGNASNIKIAKIIIHELMHAYLNIKYKNCNQGASLPYINNLDLGELIQKFYDNFNCHIDVDGSPQSQHDFMYNFLIPSFQSILSESRDLIISQSHINYANSLTFQDSSLNIMHIRNCSYFCIFV
ncbi:hypothetical protein [Flavobacterium sp.]|jgi:hypothetical protein|uniref:hypothetical protein n=1 Tax=Flavobacterium sp. TaxID=239 RepID=UPI0037C13476